MASIRLRTGMFDDAERALRGCLRLVSGESTQVVSPIQRHLALVESHRGNGEQALDWIAKSRSADLTMYPYRHASALSVESEVYERLSREKEARALFVQAEQLRKTYEYALSSGLGCHLKRLGSGDASAHR